MAHTPTLTMPNRGTRNQKNESWDPNKRSFFPKSMGDSVALDCQPDDILPFMTDRDVAKKEARNDKPRNVIGSEKRIQRSKPSAKLMKTPEIWSAIWPRW